MLWVGLKLAQNFIEPPKNSSFSLFFISSESKRKGSFEDTGDGKIKPVEAKMSKEGISRQIYTSN